MRGVTEARDWACRQWRNHWTQWLLSSGDAADELSWPLRPPTEQTFLASSGEVTTWVSQWRDLELSVPGVRVELVTRRWATGAQRLPARLWATPSAIAELAGETERWNRAVTLVTQLVEQWPEVDFSSVVPACGRALGALSEADAVRLLPVLAWLAAHPDSGLWERELPVPGVDTKWPERHRRVLEPLASAITGSGTGLRHPGIGFRVRLLDPAVGALPGEFTVDLSQLAELDIRPRRVVVCENRTSVLTLPALPGTVAVHGMGFAAPSLAEVPWLAEAATLLYWGDLDTYGLAILGTVRAVLPHVRSLLMDEATFTLYRQLAVPEPRPWGGEAGYLCLAERQVLRMIRDSGLRLEQERIPGDHVAAALLACIEQ